MAAFGRPLFERVPGAMQQLEVDAIRAYTELAPQLAKIGAAIRARAVVEGAEARSRLLERASGG